MDFSPLSQLRGQLPRWWSIYFSGTSSRLALARQSLRLPARVLGGTIMITSSRAFTAGLAAAAALSAAVGAGAAEACKSDPGGAALATAQAQAFLKTLSPLQQTVAVRGYGKAAAIRWSNLPIAMAPRVGVRLGDLTATQIAAVEALLRTALSQCGLKLLADIRAADSVLMPLDTRGIGWNPANYYVAMIGEPSGDKPWILKVDGHHIAYNITFNGAQVSATPLFDGVEPVRFTTGGRDYAPLAVQADAMRALATAVAGAAQARLEGEFRDVTRGATIDGDTNFPITYPGGAVGRGVSYAQLTGAQKALVRDAMAAWVDLPNAAISAPLMATYLQDAALAVTFVGIAGSPDLAKPGSYVRIDGPRLWIEFIVQPGARDPTGIHYHTIWRDKVADYGGAFAP